MKLSGSAGRWFPLHCLRPGFEPQVCVKPPYYFSQINLMPCWKEDAPYTPDQALTRPPGDQTKGLDLRDTLHLVRCITHDPNKVNKFKPLGQKC